MVRMTRRTLLQASGTGLASLAVPVMADAAPAGKKLRIALSNSYIGNKWRIETQPSPHFGQSNKRI